MKNVLQIFKIVFWHNFHFNSYRIIEEILFNSYCWSQVIHVRLFSLQNATMFSREYSFTTNCFLCSKSMKLYLSGNMYSWSEYIFGFFLRRLWIQKKKKNRQITNTSEKLGLFDHLHITFYFILTNFYNHILFDISAYMNKSVNHNFTNLLLYCVETGFFKKEKIIK